MIGKSVRLAPAAVLLSAPSAAAAGPRLAVLTPTAPWTPECVGDGWRKDQVLMEMCSALDALADEARAGVLSALRGRDVTVMTRENTALILKEMGGQCTEGECEVETAKLLQADYVVSGNMTQLEGSWFVTLKLHEVKTAKLLETSPRVRGKTQVELLDALRPVAEALVRSGMRVGGGTGAAARGAPVVREGTIEAQQEASFGAEAEEVLVSFDSTPEGASVLLDGQLLCKETPCRKRLPAGAHEASFQKERYDASLQRFTAAKGVAVKATLAPRFGWLAVETTPSGVGVSIDAADAGKSPVAWREVDLGSAEVLVADPCWLPSGERVAVKAGERRTVKLTGKPRLAGLKLNAEDEKGNALETDVVVDGTVAGSAGSTLKVPVCSRKVSVKLGRETFEQELKLEEGKVATLTARPGAGGGSAGRMVRLRGGTFKMGSRGDKRTVAPFSIDVTEVTAGAYAACVKSGKCSAAYKTEDWPGISNSVQEKWSNHCNWEKADQANHPINCVDWNQATAYCAAVGKRLPAEEEWEWAARGAERGTIYPWGNEEPRDQLCWSGGSAQPMGTCAAGSFPGGDSPDGIKDLAGNVWEWTSSAYDASSRVYGGGGVAASIRFGLPPVNRLDTLGFRCARTP